MLKHLHSRAGLVTAEVNNHGGRWTATLINEHPSLSKLGSTPGWDAPTAVANLERAIRRLFVGDQAPRPLTGLPR